MDFEQFYLGCLSHASYLAGNNGEVFVVDPQRDVDQYVEYAEQHGVTIKYIIETHLHADFVSGHLELAERTGAQIIIGAKADAAFDHIAARDGDVFKVGGMTLKILETPGHTPESICVLAEYHPDGPPALLFTGDTLFVGDVGRPDLVVAQGHSREEMAGMLYDSLHNKLMSLPDNVRVYPAHGAGSLCGKHMSSEKSSTIGKQRTFNYALKQMDKAAFVKMMTTDLPELPGYFARDVELNRRGAVAIKKLGRVAKLDPQTVKARMDAGAILLDVRSGVDYAESHILGSLNIGLSGQFASWAGTLIKLDTPIILLAGSVEQTEEALMRLARVGFESVVGALGGGIAAWAEAGLPLVTSPVLSVEALKEQFDNGRDMFVLDVRRPGEHEAAHVPNAHNITLAQLAERAGELPKDRDIAIICASGYRSSIAKSILERAGLTSLTNVLGGTSGWQNAGYPVANC